MGNFSNDRRKFTSKKKLGDNFQYYACTQCIRLVSSVHKQFQFVLNQTSFFRNSPLANVLHFELVSSEYLPYDHSKNMNINSSGCEMTMQPNSCIVQIGPRLHPEGTTEGISLQQCNTTIGTTCTSSLVQSNEYMDILRSPDVMQLHHSNSAGGGGAASMIPHGNQLPNNSHEPNPVVWRPLFPQQPDNFGYHQDSFARQKANETPKIQGEYWKKVEEVAEENHELQNSASDVWKKPKKKQNCMSPMKSPDGQRKGILQPNSVSQEGSDINSKCHKCPHCEYSSKFANSVKKHLRVHSGEQTFKCEYCGRCFKQHSHLRIHVRGHTSKQPVQCDFCGKFFKTKGSLQNHLQVHTLNEVYKCSVCDKSFVQKMDLQNHAQMHASSQPFRCYICEKDFQDSVTLQNHLQVHNSDKPYECNVCKKKFRLKGTLYKHRQTHNNKQTLKCHVCDKVLQTREGLENHVRMHTGERPFLCIVCRKTFSQRSHLQNHIRTHTGERPYKCQFCGKSFGKKGNLRTHQRVHTGEKPYGCSLCGKRFSWNKGLKLHVAAHHEGQNNLNVASNVPEQNQGSVLLP